MEAEQAPKNRSFHAIPTLPVQPAPSPVQNCTDLGVSSLLLFSTFWHGLQLGSAPGSTVLLSRAHRDLAPCLVPPAPMKSRGSEKRDEQHFPGSTPIDIASLSALVAGLLSSHQLSRPASLARLHL